MENKISSAIEKYNMISPGDTVVVGFSGGADSCALLHYLNSVREKLGIALIACHVNHMLRGEEADKDESFTRSFCEKNGIGYRLLRADVRKAAAERHESTELCGRNIRYRFFDETARPYGAKIATAHTASDNAETVLFNLTRGSGIKGLCGIPAVRGNIIRPLIGVTRAEIEAYCERHGISYVTDSSNLSDDYTRNKLRHNVIPVLTEINPSFEQAVSRMTQNLSDDADFLRCEAERFIAENTEQNGIKTVKLKALHRSLSAQVIFLLLQEYGAAPDAVQLDMIRNIIHSGGAVQIKKDIFAVSKQGFLRIIKRDEAAGLCVGEIPFLPCREAVISHKIIRTEKLNMEQFHNNKKNPDFLFHNYLDYGTIPSEAVFRFRRSGDIFRLPERNVTKTVKKLFNELKIPAERRGGILLLAAGERVLWIEGAGASADCLVTEDSKAVLKIEVTEQKGAAL